MDLRRRPDRAWHLLTALVAAVAVGWQLWLVVDGIPALVPGNEAPLGTDLVRFVSYFTILSNLLVLVGCGALLRADPAGRGWRVLRLDAVVCIGVTGVVHWFLLRPILDLHGASYAVDKLLHVVVPVMAVAGWVLLGPRRAAGRADVLPALAFPVLWLAYTLVHGAVSGWYPYPFVDVEHARLRRRGPQLPRRRGAVRRAVGARGVGRRPPARPGGRRRGPQASIFWYHSTSTHWPNLKPTSRIEPTCSKPQALCSRTLPGLGSATSATAVCTPDADIASSRAG